MSDRPSMLPDLRSEIPLRTGWFWSLYGVWFRHQRVYCQTLLANATPPVLEPLFFFTSVAIGLGGYIQTDFDGLSYRTFVASGLAVSSAMFTAVFETTFGTFVRLVYQKTYDAMLGTHLRVREMFIGELLFAATKGAIFSTIVILVTLLFGARPNAWCLLVPVLGLVTAYLFGAIGLIVTSYVKTMNNFAFFTSGVITPLFFFSGTFFPILGHHPLLDAVANSLPLIHAIELSRALYKAQFDWATAAHAAILTAYVVVCHIVALRRMTRRVLG
jgi:lipooligosaccharide transport system permease protein